ncbi:MCE family protein [Nocardia sp. 2]|uniref:MCE family protein n=1 Tax=Nocardia acididurans TaxID=2802282 RepID=A0ABS1MIU2_9NOCA|nr:MlaD family protein [Nocardia acididurans]MBL1079599.1 MCE family protein [Nocardia acididurans]
MRRPKLSSILSLGSIAVITVLAVAYLLTGIARVDWFTRHTGAVMLIPDSANLVPRSPVLLSGVRVGQIDSVRNTVNGVEVHFLLDPGARIPADSSVVIESLSALSEPYINFRPTTGNGPYLSDGEMIRTTSIRTPLPLPQLAGNLTDLVRQLDPNTLKSLVQTMTQALGGTAALVPTLARASDLLAATLLARMPQIRQLLINAQVPGAQVAEAGAQMSEAGPQFAEFGVKVNQVVDALQHLINARPVPQAYTDDNGLLSLLPKVIDRVERIGPDLQKLYPVVGPLIDSAAASTTGIDLSALIEQALAGVSPNGALQLQITPR